MAQIADVQAAWEIGDRDGALRIASRLRGLGEYQDAIRRGWQAANRPDFYRQLGKDPEALVAAGHAALRERFGL